MRNNKVSNAYNPIKLPKCLCNVDPIKSALHKNITSAPLPLSQAKPFSRYDHFLGKKIILRRTGTGNLAGRNVSENRAFGGIHVIFVREIFRNSGQASISRKCSRLYSTCKLS